MTRLRVPYGTARDQLGELWTPTGAGSRTPWPLVVLYHGGFWKAQYTHPLMDPLALDVTQRGWAAWNLEYRRVGDGGGGGGWPMTLDDAYDGLQAVGELADVDHGRVITCGHSAGGYLAIWTARASRSESVGDERPAPRSAAASTGAILPAAAVSLAGVLDLVGGAEQRLGDGAVERLMGGTPSAVPERYASASLLTGRPCGVRQVVVHGTDDVTVPPAMSVSYAEASRAAGDETELVLLDGLDHMSLIDPSSAGWQQVVGRLAALFD